MLSHRITNSEYLLLSNTLRNAWLAESPPGSFFKRAYQNLASSYVWHLIRHYREKRNICMKRQAGHINNGTSHITNIHSRFHFTIAIGLQYAGFLFLRHVTGGIAYIDLTASNIKSATVKRNGFG
jgi:hypothetical protein